MYFCTRERFWIMNSICIKFAKHGKTAKTLNCLIFSRLCAHLFKLQYLDFQSFFIYIYIYIWKGIYYLINSLFREHIFFSVDVVCYKYVCLNLNVKTRKIEPVSQWLFFFPFHEFEWKLDSVVRSVV